MARSTMEVLFLGTQKTSVEGTNFVKVFYGDEPDGITEHGLSIIGMSAGEDVADEVFAAGAHFKPMEPVRITFEIARGGQNKGKNLVLHLEPVSTRPGMSSTPNLTSPAPAKPADAKS